MRQADSETQVSEA